MKVADTLLAVHSDFHSGGSTALFPNRFWQFKHSNHTPTPAQKRMWQHFDKCTEYGAQARKGKRMIVVHDGDAIDGVHHGSIQAVTFLRDEQCEIHTELMDYFLRKTKFDRKAGDRLFYVSGTASHVEDKEEAIAKDLSAEKSPDGNYVYDHLELEINGRLVWFLHHGKTIGFGAKEGNELRNWLRDIHVQCDKRKVRPPDLIITGHTHAPGFSIDVYSTGNDYHVMHGVICPSYQQKTRYAHQVAPVAVNEIGSVFVEIKADGEIRLPKILKMETETQKAVMV